MVLVWPAVRQAHLRRVLWLLLLGSCPVLSCLGGEPLRVDSGVSRDAGVDAGPPASDGGRPPRDAGVPDAGFKVVPIELWCSFRALAECSRDMRCGRLSQAGLVGCMLRRNAVAQCDQAGLEKSVRQGRIQYLETEAVKCLDALGSGSCEEAPQSCADVFTGLAPPDAGCFHPLDCNSLGFCDESDGLCPHTCRAWRDIGMSCNGFNHRCDPLNASCDLDDAGVAVCLPKKRDGDPCQRLDACPETSSCLMGKCVTQRAGPGESCHSDTLPSCQAEYFCRQGPAVNGVKPPGSCERRSGLGGACTGSATCLPSLRCSSAYTTGTCQRKGSLHQPCAAGDDCEDDLFCDSRTQRCEALPDAGGDCSVGRTGFRCAPGSSCVISGTFEGVCAAWKTVGQECEYDDECLSDDCRGATLPDGGQGGTCVANCSQR